MTRTSFANALRWVGVMLALCAATACAQSPTKVEMKAAPPCGSRPGDWCTKPGNDPCGAHPDAMSCEADAQCAGLAYRGESLVKCQYDGRGFHGNCPVVGCRSPRPDAPVER